MAKACLWFTLLVVVSIIKGNSATPFFWNLFQTTTTSSVTTTTSTPSNSSADTYSETYNNDNNNNLSIPLSFGQRGSTVDGSAVQVVDQFLGDINVNISKRSAELPPFYQELYSLF